MSDLAQRLIPPQTRRRTGGVRWGIAVLLGVGILVNYFDRVNMSAAGGSLGDYLHLTPVTLGIVLSSFTWSYGLAQIPVGLLLDKIGIKWVMRVTTIVWVAATLLTAFASGLGMLLVARLILGTAEAPAIVSSQKSTGYWFPRRQRGLATSLFDGAAKFSNVIGLPLMSVIIALSGWRAAFIATAIISTVFAIVYWALYRNPRELHRAGRLSDAELDYITDGGAQNEDYVPPRNAAAFGYLLTKRKIWGLSIGFACYNYAFYLLLTWLPTYLEKGLHMTVMSGGLSSAIPYLVATAADILIGGVLVDALIARGRDANRVRKTVLVGGMVIGLAVAGAALTHTPWVALVFISIGLGGLSASAPVGSSCVALIAPPGQIGATGGILNFLAQLFAAGAPIITGFLVSATGSYAWGFVTAGITVFVGVIFYTLVLGRIEAIPAPPDASTAQPVLAV